MTSISSWIERKLYLKVNATKSKVVRPTRSKYLGLTFLNNGGEWKVKPISEKKAKTIFKNLYYLNRKHKNGFNEESIFKVANSRLGWYKRCSMNVVNYILNPTLLETKIKDGAGLLNPLNYYLRKVGI